MSIRSWDIQGAKQIKVDITFFLLDQIKRNARLDTTEI